MSATKKRTPVTGDDSLLRDLHKVFGGTIVTVDQRVDDVTITTAKHGDVEGCTIVLNDMQAEGFDFTMCAHFLDVRKAAYAIWDKHDTSKGYKAKAEETPNVIQFNAPPPPRPGNDNRKRIDPFKRPRPGVWYDDFYAIIPTRCYVYIPTRELWPASGVNAILGSVPLTKSWQTGTRY